MDYKNLLNEIPFELSKKEVIDRITLLLPKLSKEKLLILYLDICYKFNNQNQWLDYIELISHMVWQFLIMHIKCDYVILITIINFCIVKGLHSENFVLHSFRFK